MDFCNTCNIVFESYKVCPLCNLREHNNEVHDFIESKGQQLVNELVEYQHRKTPDTKEDSQNINQQLKSEIHALVEKWRNTNMSTAQLVIALDQLSGELSDI